VLWPSDESLSLEQLRAATPPARWARGLTLLALDSTWAGARKLLHRLPPGAARLSVDAAAFDPGRSLLYPARRYSGHAAERHCTYEAVVAVLDALGALRGGERQALLLNLKLKIDALLRHKNRRPAYGKDTAEALAAARELALRQIAAE
jgi:DTW domain-containing protein YfiP